MNWVGKTWGAEQWVIHNELYSVKFLHLLPGYQSSLHRHLIKDETFYVQQGGVTVELGEEVMLLLPGQSVRIPPGAWHRFSNAEKNHMAIIVEGSTCHDDADVERKEPSRRSE